MTDKLCRRADLVAELVETDRVVLRSVSASLEVVAPAQAVPLLSFCTTPRSRAEVVEAFGPMAGDAFDVMREGGLLVSPAVAVDTPLFFQGFATIDSQRRMLEDEPRVDAYAEAIRSVVQPGDVVLDAGTGTGLLAAMAALAGAEHVYAVERSDAIRMAEAVMEATGVADRVTLVRGDLRSVDLPTEVDVLVTETFGAMALAEGGFDDVLACARRWLRPGGRVVPGAIQLWFAPVADAGALPESPEVFGEVHGVDLRPLRPLALGRGIVEDIPSEALAHGGEVAARWSYPSEGHVRGSARFELEPGTLAGWAAWFTLELADGIHLPTGPTDPRTHWHQVFLPLEAVPHGGGVVELEVEVVPAAGDRRGIEVHSSWSGVAEGVTTHRVV